jgi:hypothetical protein
VEPEPEPERELECVNMTEPELASLWAKMHAQGKDVIAFGLAVQERVLAKVAAAAREHSLVAAVDKIRSSVRAAQTKEHP